MPVPPNLVTSHADDVGEFIHAGDVNDIATALNSFPVVNSVAYFGADPTGVADSTAAFNNALAALPLNNGTTYAPPGNYRINGTLNLGNGTNSALSTRYGMRLLGAAPPGPLAITGYPATAPTRLFSGTSGQDMIHVNGPLQGWCLENLQLDGAGIGRIGVQVTAGQGGGMRNVSFNNWTLWAYYSASFPDTGALASYNVNTQHNVHQGIHFSVPNINSAAAAAFTGAGEPSNVITSGTSNELWQQVSILFATPTAGNSLYGIYYQVCAEVVIRNLRFIGAANQGNVVRSITYDFSLGAQLYPSDNLIETVDFQTNSPGLYLIGQPASTSKNKIVNICSHVGGLPPDPNLMNLAWGYSNASP